MPLHARTSLRCCAIAAAVCLLVSCTSDRTEPMLQGAVPPSGRAVFVEAFTAAEPAWERHARRLRSRLSEELSRTGEVAVITTRPPAVPAQRPLVVSGELVAVDEGSEAVRFLVGIGFGGPSLRARVRVVDAGGQPVLEFEQTRTSRDGNGLAGHWNPIDMDDEIDALAAASATTVARWLGGQKL